GPNAWRTEPDVSTGTCRWRRDCKTVARRTNAECMARPNADEGRCTIVRTRSIALQFRLLRVHHSVRRVWLGKQLQQLSFRFVLLLLALGVLVVIAPVSIIVAGQQGQASGGEMTNAAPQAAVFDTQHRPITAGGLV